MIDYLVDLKKDLVTQFQDQPNIEALVEVVQKQLMDLSLFYSDLRDKRSVHTAEGKQLDGIGQIVVLTRADAGEMANYKEPTYVMEDEEYRRYLLFKILKNTNTCTYYDVQTAFRMFWDKPLYYSEYPNQPLDTQYPATMVFETSVCKPEDHVEKMFELPFIKAAGVAVIIIAYTEAEEMEYTLTANSHLGQGYMETELPEAYIVGSLMVWGDGDEIHISGDSVDAQGTESVIVVNFDDMNVYGSGKNIVVENT